MFYKKKSVIVLIFFGFFMPFLQEASFRGMKPYTEEYKRLGRSFYRKWRRSRFGKQYRKEKEKFAKNWIKNFFYGGIGLAGYLYLDNQLQKKYEFKKDLLEEFRTNENMQDFYWIVAERGGKILLCDSYAPLPTILQNFVTQKLFSIITNPSKESEAKDIMMQELNDIFFDYTRVLAQRAMDHFFYETSTNKKLIVLASAFTVSVLIMRSVSVAYASLGFLGLLLRSKAITYGGSATALFVAQMTLDQKKIVDAVGAIAHANIDTILPIIDQFGYEAKTFGANEIALRDAFILYFFSSNISKRKNLEYIPFTNIDQFLQKPEVRKELELVFRDMIRSCYKYSQNVGEISTLVLGKIFLGTKEPSIPRPITSKDIKNTIYFAKKARQERWFEEISPTTFPYFLESSAFIDWLASLLTKKEFNPTCTEESTEITIEEVE